MSDTTYRKTPLPVRLDLNKRNTKEQLNKAVDDKRGMLEGAGYAPSPSKESTKDCNDVMRKDLVAWLSEHGISGPPPSPEAEQRAMWQWIRDFHKEYNDDWYARNMPRLRDQFRPIFVQEMKRMRGDNSTPNSQATPPKNDSQDLLSFDAPSPATPAPAPPAGTNLLDM
ncbi:hypothetical protein AK812_SmicGene6518 [Symbiodinium microadriaticum]|uniref:Uncharacterized protein n=1 Tax=Symbiodinium microadriaticum TaxID=2951 RepID=A0A1Q9EQY5_SYMMI|nr:hypothetical protein AK812_SmicGene6518 [Symbiodinium microadriaticum]